MLKLAPGVHQLTGFPRHKINVYVVEDILVDAGTVLARGRILRQTRGLNLRANLVTHAHPDHFGSSRAICTKLNLPLWAGALDAPSVQSGRPVTGPGRLSRLLGKYKMAPGRTVDRLLKEGDEVAGFTVLDVPGHTPGHIALWRESDRVLICGDVFFNLRRLSSLPASSRGRRSATESPCAASQTFSHDLFCSVTANRLHTARQNAWHFDGVLAGQLLSRFPAPGHAQVRRA